MNIRGQLLTVILLPILAMAGLSFYVHLKSWNRLENQIARRGQSRSEEFKLSFERLQTVCHTIARALATNIHVRKAMQNDDLDALFNISSGFKDIDSLQIIFIDMENRVLLRNYDELRFGDILGFSPSKIGKQLINVDQKLSLGSLLPIKLDGVDLVGHVLVKKPLDREGLTSITKSINPEVAVGVSYSYWHASSLDLNERKGWSTVSNHVMVGNDKLKFQIWENYISETKFLESKILVNTIQTLVLISIIIATITYFLQKQIIIPFKRLLQEINKYAKEQKPSFLNIAPNNELNQICRALDNMYDEIEGEKAQKSLLMKEVMHDKEKLKRDNTLLQVLCHDLSNPLLVIKGSATLLFKKIELAESEAGLKKRMLRSIGTTESIIQHVKDMMALQSGKHSLILTDLSLGQIVDEAMFIFEEKLKKKNLELEYIPTGQYTFRADKNSFSNNVFNNIVSNAIKFSPGGSKIQILERLEKDKIIIEIIDQGVGIPQEAIRHIFSSNTKTSTVGTDGEPGTGFGMPLASTYMSYFGGTIQVTSRTQEEFPGSSGTTFTLTLNGKPKSET